MDKIKRFDLIPASAIKGIAEVFGIGTQTYQADQWRLMQVSELLNKLKEKLANFEDQEDYDDDGMHNLDKVAAYAMMLRDLLITNPHRDDRIDKISTTPRIALDVDEVVADFLGAYETKFGVKLNPYWQSDYNIADNLKGLMEDEDFWVNIPVKHIPTFEPACYISSRSIPVEWTKKFIQKNGLPCAPVYHVPWNESKVETLKENNIDVLIDDKPENFLEATRAGVYALLMDAPHNQWFNAKNRRIYNLNLFQ
jgi:Domain of unknown function (DUF5664)